jgi:hypothetical protein
VNSVFLSHLYKFTSVNENGVEVKVEVEVEVNLRQTVSRPVCLGVRRLLGPVTNFYFSFKFPGRVCNLLYICFWALPEQSLLGRSPAELTAIFYCLTWDYPNLEGQVPVFISPRNKVAQLYPRALGSLYVASYDSQGSGEGILTRLHTGKRSSQTSFAFIPQFPLFLVFPFVTCAPWLWIPLCCRVLLFPVKVLASYLILSCQTEPSLVRKYGSNFVLTQGINN